MFLILLSGLCLFVSMGLGSLIFIGIPILLFKFPAAVMTVLEIGVSLFKFYWEIVMFLLGVFLDIASAFVHIFTTLLPVMMHHGTHIYYTLDDYWQIFRYQYMPQILDFAHQQTQMFLLFCGLVGTTFYAFLNNFRVQIAGDRVPRHGRRDHNENYHGFNNDGDNAFDDDDDDDNEDNRRNERIAGNGLRNRTRLYPDLGNLNDTGDLLDRHGVDEGRTCVVCYERNRNAAVFPCGHTELCLQCTRVIMGRNRRCPICQGRIAEFRQVYI